MAADYHLVIINNQSKLEKLAERLISIPLIALDIETVEWWNQQRERIALIQLAFRHSEKIFVVIIDALAEIDPETLRPILESTKTIKVIHNAGFDAAKISKFYQIIINPVFDTMLAARRSGEKKYSLAAQAANHLNLQLDKGTQRSDWSRRPLNIRQLNYAALDPYAALLLYESQQKRELFGDYRTKTALSTQQPTFSFDKLPESAKIETKLEVDISEDSTTFQSESTSTVLSSPVSALLGIVTELPSRYGPDQLVVSVGIDRIGLAGWIMDQSIGSETDFDQETARLAITELLEKKLIRFTETGRLEATEEGAELWHDLKHK